MSKNIVTLNASFDIAQTSEQLVWSFTNSNGNSIQQKNGKKSGMYAFSGDPANGDQLKVQVSATGVPSSGTTVWVLDCNLITTPAKYPENSAHPNRAGKYPYPSPFFVAPANGSPGAGATTVISGFTSAPVHNGTIVMTPQTQPVVVNAGQWKISFVITVGISDGSATTYRVFQFDPEGDVDPGNFPP